MSDENEATINGYNTTIQDYAASTFDEVPKLYKERFTEGLNGFPLNATIFEIGSATGRDAKFIESLGYKVQRSDAAVGFLDLLSEQGYDAVNFNIIDDDFPQQYDVILANAVLVHLKRDEVTAALEKIYEALLPGGRFIFDLKKGDSSDDGFRDVGIGSERYFSYWQEDEIRDVLSKLGFEIKRFDLTVGKQMTRLAFIVQKGQQ